MLHVLGGGSPKSPADYYGRTITAATVADDEFRLTFADGVSVRVYDDGQSCCESRYMRTDDDVAALVGRKLLAIESNNAKSDEASNEAEYGGRHDVTFLDVKTDGGMVSISFHNEHNGYYGGFGLSLDEVPHG